MKKLLITCLTIGFASTLTNYAFADDYNPAKTNFFIGGLGGITKIHSFDTNPNPGSSFNQDSNNLAWGATGGFMYSLTPFFNLGLQGDYLSLGQTKYSGTNNLGEAVPGNNFQIKDSAWDALITATFYIPNTGFNIAGKGGVAYLYQRYSGLTGNGLAIPDNTQYLPEAGVSIGYLWQSLNFSVEYRHIFGKNQTTVDNSFNQTGPAIGQFNPDNATVDALFFSITYQFNLDPNP